MLFARVVSSLDFPNDTLSSGVNSDTQSDVTAARLERRPVRRGSPASHGPP
jgi:hypothetical protein